MTRFRAWWATPRSSLITHRTLKWLWFFQFPVVYFIATEKMSPALGIAYLGFVSIYANMVGHWSAEEAADAKIKADAATAELGSARDPAS